MWRKNFGKKWFIDWVMFCEELWSWILGMINWIIWINKFGIIYRGEVNFWELLFY